MAKFIDLTGQRFGKLTAVRRDGSTSHGTALWLCKCDCGNEIIVRSGCLIRGSTTSCGCSRIKHGGTKTKLYFVWCGIKQRCFYKGHNRYHVYGGKGIRLCEEWLEFENFKRWAIENGYHESLTIDRIDCDGDYKPSNCRWVTYKKQANNKQNNHLVTYDGETHTIAEWADLTGFTYATIQLRLKRGWSAERVFTQKPRTPKRRKA